MSGFTSSCRGQTSGALRAAGAFPEKYAAWKRGPGVGGRAQRGCLGFLIFGIAYIFVPLILFLCVEVVLLVYAALMGVLWGLGAAIDGAAGRRSATKKAAPGEVDEP